MNGETGPFQALAMTELLSMEACKLRESVIGHRSDTPPQKSSVAPVYFGGKSRPPGALSKVLPANTTVLSLSIFPRLFLIQPMDGPQTRTVW